MRRAERTRPAPPVEVTVGHLGARGDGVAELAGDTLFVAGALAGERVLVRPGVARADGREALLVEVLAASPGRIEPPCAHFGTCGGCAVQNLAAPAYGAWKHAVLVEALRRRGFPATPVAPVASAPPGARRRARFALEAHGKGLRPAFRAARSHDLVAPGTCPVLDDGLLPATRAVAAALAPHGVHEIEVTRTLAGLDAMVIARRPPGPDESFDLAGAADSADLARIAWREEGRPPYSLAERRMPRLAAGGIEVELPAGAFVQPTAWGEAAIGDRLGAILPPGGRIADLFAGCGLLGFAQSAGRRIDAFEASPAMVTAAQRAAAAARLEGYRAESRDLERSPLDAATLARFDAVVLDPPRGGAHSQCVELAASAVPVVAYVSCHPGSFARDARILADGGYDLVDVAPLDQFLWSHHLELVARFTRR